MNEKLINEKKIPELDTMYIDPGIPANKEISLSLGDCAVFERPMVKQGKKIIAKALDNRIGCAVAIETLKQLKTTPNDICFLFTVQEEGLTGVATGTYNINPDIAIAIEVTVTGDSPEGWYSPVKLEGGPVITLIDKGIFAYPAVKEGLIQAAGKINIPYQFEVLDSGATDAATMQLARQGVLAGNICIPCRYIHSPSEMADLDDVENTIKLLHRYLQT
jgi:putative aminopeptidase FrvX